jgi:hypothetical protein
MGQFDRPGTACCAPTIVISGVSDRAVFAHRQRFADCQASHNEARLALLSGKRAFSFGKCDAARLKLKSTHLD